jgi:pimeloyl-ACP methyl ester carboxylesterase
MAALRPQGWRAAAWHHAMPRVYGHSLNDSWTAFAEAGFVALTFDYRGYGGSEGIKRRLIPLEQIDDIRNAISYFETLPEIDPERIGLWGTSFGGANAPYTAAVDNRIRAVVGQVGFGDGERFLLDTRRFGEREVLLKKVAEDRRRRAIEGAGDRLSPLEALNSGQTNAFLGDALKDVAPSASISRGRRSRRRSNTSPLRLSIGSRRVHCF